MKKKEYDLYLKRIKKEDQKNNLKYNKFNGLIIRTMLTIIIFLSMGILCKYSSKYESLIYENVYNKNLSFTKIKSFYNKYLGGVVPLDLILTNTEPVFKESLSYSEVSTYLDGVKLTVNNHYLIPTMEEGIVVYIGEKDGYGKVVIIQGIDGVDIWYGNLANYTVNLYDYIDKGELLGETNDEYLYLVYSKEGKFLDYNNYLN